MVDKWAVQLVIGYQDFMEPFVMHHQVVDKWAVQLVIGRSFEIEATWHGAVRSPILWGTFDQD